MSKSTSVEPVKAPPPSPHLTVDLPGGQRELFMSYGVLGELANLVGGPEAVPNLSFDGATREAALFLILAERNKRGKIVQEDTDENPVVPYDMTVEAAEQMLDWVAAHVLDFFIRRFASSSKMFATQAGQLVAVGSSLTSSPTSPGKTA